MGDSRSEFVPCTLISVLRGKKITGKGADWCRTKHFQSQAYIRHLLIAHDSAEHLIMSVAGSYSTIFNSTSYMPYFMLTLLYIVLLLRRLQDPIFEEWPHPFAVDSPLMQMGITQVSMTSQRRHSSICLSPLISNMQAALLSYAELRYN